MHCARCRPDELVRCGAGEFQLRSHDSFKINEASSVWHWKSRDIGGKSALDYLVHVEGVPFLNAVKDLLEQEPPDYLPRSKAKKRKPFVLPAAAGSMQKVEAYLRGRGISREVIRYCARKGILYESEPYHNCVFVGLDGQGVPRYAALRGTHDGKNAFKQEKAGSDKRYCFCIPPLTRARRVSVYEAAPDALAHMTLEGGRADKYRLSLGGIYAPAKESSETKFKEPAALEEFLRQHPEVDELEVCTDNDRAGRWAAERLQEAYQDKLKIFVNLPKIEGCDYAELTKRAHLARQKNIECR